MFDQHAPQNSLQSIVPDLASSWSLSEDGKELTFKLRQGVKWHDGKPFTAKDVQCTWDMITGQSSEKLRVNPRQSWYPNLASAGGKFDRAWQGIMSIPLMKQLKEQEPNAECTVVPWNIPRQLIVNRSKPPFDNPELRRAMALTLDRRAFIDILSDGQGEIGGAMKPPPGGSWGMPPEGVP